MHINDISNVQNNMGVKVDYYYLLEPKHNELWYFHGFNHQNVKLKNIFKQKNE
jgi:hypothetical protein